LRQGKTLDEYDTPEAKAVTPGGPGSQWRMMKLRRVYETAEEEGKSVEDVACERFGSLEEFEAAKEERRILDEREGKRSVKEAVGNAKGKERDGEKRFMFNNVNASSAPSRNSSFRRPELGDSSPSTPSPTSSGSKKTHYDSLRLSFKGSTDNSSTHSSHTPVPSVMTPTAIPPSNSQQTLSASALNKLQAKVLRAKLMNAPNADSLQEEYDQEVRRANGVGIDREGPIQPQVEVLPTLDARGRLYDVGQGREHIPDLPGNKKKTDKVSATSTATASAKII
jgi:hypothetical protein